MTKKLMLNFKEDKDHAKFKAFCALKGEDMNPVALEAIEEKMEREQDQED